MKKIVLIVLVCSIQSLIGQTKKIVDPFNKVIISPHIETVFVQGEEESVTILDSTESEDKINIEVNKNTLRVYLDGAKDITKRKKELNYGVNTKTPIYKGKILTIKVIYKNLENLSIRGEQKTVCENLIDKEKFRLKIFGESQ